jgi:hypothetical protein
MTNARVVEPFEYIDPAGRRITATFRAATPDYHDRFGAMMYDSIEIKRRSSDFKNDPQFDPRFTQPFSELNAVAFLFVAAGYAKVNLHSERPPRPDIRAELADGSTVFVEVAEVIESPAARLQGALSFINVGIAKAIESDPALQTKLNGYFISVRAWMTHDGRYSPNAALGEFLDFLQTSDPESLPRREFIPFDPRYPSLSSMAATYYCDKFDGILIPRFDIAAHSFSPESLAAQVVTVMQDKQEKAASYKGSPLWLALYVSDPLGSSELSLESLRGISLDFSPFAKMFVGDQRNVMVYSAELSV